jgi:hypothetical protein
VFAPRARRRRKPENLVVKRRAKRAPPLHSKYLQSDSAQIETCMRQARESQFSPCGRGGGGGGGGVYSESYTRGGAISNEVGPGGKPESSYLGQELRQGHRDTDFPSRDKPQVVCVQYLESSHGAHSLYPPAWDNNPCLLVHNPCILFCQYPRAVIKGRGESGSLTPW